VTLASLTLRDLGVSAFEGKNRSSDAYALGEFLAAVRAGRVSAGSYLIVENLDRLSREETMPAVNLFTSILLSGIAVVQLMPSEVVFTAKSDAMDLMRAVLEMSRGHNESATKSVRVGGAWANKRKEAAGRIITLRLPGWVRFDGDLQRAGGKVVLNGQLALIPERAEVVRRVFRLAREGMGVHLIARQLNAEKVPVLGRTVFRGKPVVWSETVVYHLLTSKATYGEYQPCKGRGSQRTADGEPVAHYYPPAIDRDEFYAVQTLLRTRARCGRGKRGKHINLFAGLLRDARGSGTLTYKHLKKRSGVLIPVGAKQGRGTPWTCYSAGVFEAAVLSRLREVKAADVFPDRGSLAVEAAEARLEEVERLIRKWQEKMDDEELVELVSAKLKQLAARQKAAAEDLETARQEAASPLADSWGDFKSLAELLADDNSDAVRGRVQAALRRTVDSVWVLITKGRPRVCAVQVWFKGEPARHRDYLILHVPPSANRHARREGRWQVWSFAETDVPTGLDLRRRAHAERLAKVLASADPSAWGE
jgi:DNA invertase Pin-like site-specific DNA recombinase